jgi:hypothetical protein
MTPSVPSWLGELATGRWVRLSGDTPDLNLPATPIGTRYLQDGDPALDGSLNPRRGPGAILRKLARRYVKAPWSGRCDFPSITEAWNGAVFAERFGESGAMIVFGGGHNDYFGSDVHAFDLATRRWKRISDGYVSGAPDEYGQGAVYRDAVYPDGSPLPPHTYAYVQYDPLGNDYLLFKGQAELGPDVRPTPIPHMFNLDTLTWRRGPKNEAAVLNSGGWTTWDATRRILWGNSGTDGNAFIGFSPDRGNDDGTFGSWGTLYPNKLPDRADHNAMAIDPRRDIIVVAVHGLNALHAIDPAEPEKAIAQLSSRGSRPAIMPYAAIEYAPNLDALIYFSANDGANICSIKAPRGATWPQLTARDWSWSNILEPDNRIDPIADAAAASRHPVNRSHTFGRFRVATYGSADVAILVRHVDSPVYVMRLS